MFTNKFAVLASYLALKVYAQHGEKDSETMGPVAFMWPPDREWGAAQDNTAPCGSAASVADRIGFPLLNGQIALVAQDESWSIQVAISNNNNPTSNDDFETVIAAMRIPELSEGHMCYPIPNPSADVEAGSNATLQIAYTSDFGNDRNETYYACADIVYLPTSQFTTQVPCFNATVDDYDITDVPDDDDSSTTASSGAASQTSAAAQASSSSNGVSNGAIAGITVGVVIGVTAILAGIILVWRRSQQKKRQRAQEASVRNVKWTDPVDSASNTSRSRDDNDIPLGDIRR